MKNIIWYLGVFLLMTSCYQDKGNYAYHDINQLKVVGVDSIYKRDQFDSLYITPDFKGTQYDREDLFEYQWDINRKVISTKKNLVCRIAAPLGENEGRLSIKDKELGTQTFCYFKLEVSSSTAGDAIVVLSNYKKQAELSYKRLDKMEAPFVTNYYQELTGEVLGHQPQSLSQNYLPYKKNSTLQVLMEEGLKSMEVETMLDMPGGGYVDGTFVYDVCLPKPDFQKYKVTGVNQIMGMYYEFFGLLMQMHQSYIVADNLLTIFAYSTTSSTQTFIGTVLSSPYGGSFSPVVMPAFRTLAATGQGYDISNDAYLFDETVGRFVRCDVRKKLVKVDELGDYSGYKMQYASNTVDKYYCMAILNNGSQTKGLYLKLPSKASENNSIPYTIVGQVNISQEILNEKSICRMMGKTSHLMIATDDKLFKCNIKDWESGIVPTMSNCVKTLKDYGYSSDAKITCMNISRSFKNIVLGVSRYGTDLNGDSDELKGDVLVIDADTYELKNQYKGVCGYPVDIMVKYQNFYTEGRDKDGVLRDNI